MPEFLERRFNPTCRYLFAVCSLVLWIVAQMAVVMLAGGKAMKGMFGWNETATIIGLAVLAGSYTIYGGLVSVAWTDFLQFVVMMLGGLIVTVIGLHKVGGLHDLMMVAPGEVQDHLPDHGQGVSVVRRLEFVPLDGHLVQLHQPVHRAALPGRAQRMGRADGRGVRRLHENPAAAAGGHSGHRGLQALPGPGGQGPGVPDAGAGTGAGRA